MAVTLLLCGCATREDLCQRFRKVPVDLLAIRYDSNPAANGKIRALAASVRSLSDVAEAAAKITAHACVAIDNDLQGLPTDPDAPNNKDAAQSCGPLATRIRAILDQVRQEQGNAAVVVSWEEPHCETDLVQLGRCEATCASAVGLGVEAACRKACDAQSHIYGVCYDVSVAPTLLGGAGESRDAVVLRDSLEQHLPALIYAHTALGLRLQRDATELIKLAAELPAALREIGPFGAACLVCAAKDTQSALASLEESTRASGEILGLFVARPTAPQLGTQAGASAAMARFGAGALRGQP